MQQPPYQPVPPPPPYQPMPAPKKPRRLWIPISILVLALAVCGLCALTTNTNTSNSQASADTPSDPTPTSTGSHMSVVMTQHSPTAVIHPTATHAPAPTPTPEPAANTAPILGAPLSAFLAKYGQPNERTDTKNGLYHFNHYPGSHIDGLIIMLDLTTTTRNVIGINVQASDTSPGWTTQEAYDACSPFFPPDATYQHNVTLPSGNGIDAFYFSSSLASAFPPSDFQDVQQNPAKPGTFDVQYLLRSNTEERIVSCDLQPGTSQSQ